MSSAPRELLDEGLARERTALAWTRSGLSVLACVALMSKEIWEESGPAADVALGIICGAAILWLASMLAVRGPRFRAGGPVRPTGVVFALMTAGTLVLAGAALVLAAVHP